MSSRLREILLNVEISPEQQQRNFDEIQAEVLRSSRSMRSEANFTAFHPDDLRCMFEAYDRRVMDRSCATALAGRKLDFILSARMTKAGGRTAWRITRSRRTGETSEEFEIAVSSHLLFQTFRDDSRAVTVTGLECRDRLQAMQRIVEHEIIHLSEQLVWRNSSCRARRFQSIARRLFGHRAHTHDLVTTSQVARQQHGIRRGSRVAFEFEGRRFEGVVNRITKRVTVLVPDAAGFPYSDGRRYRKFYIPLPQLQCLDGSRPSG